MFDKDKYQVVFELNHSQAHKRYTPDTFLGNNMNLSPGGAVPFIWDIIIGPEPDKISSYNILNKLKCGDVDIHKFVLTDNPPKLNPCLPKEDTLGPIKIYLLTWK